MGFLYLQIMLNLVAIIHSTLFHSKFCMSLCSACVPTIHSAPNHILGSGWTSFGLCNGYAGESVQGWNLKLDYVFSHQCVPPGCKAHYKLLLTWWLSAKGALLMGLASLWRKARFIFQRVMSLVRPCFMFLQWCQYLSQVYTYRAPPWYPIEDALICQLQPVITPRACDDGGCTLVCESAQTLNLSQVVLFLSIHLDSFKFYWWWWDGTFDNWNNLGSIWNDVGHFWNTPWSNLGNGNNLK